MTEQALEMPRFEFANLSFKTDEELEAYEKANGGAKKQYVEKNFKPGRHDVVIEKVEFKGKAEKDPTWLNVVLHLKGTGEKRISKLIQVPTQDIKYGDKGSTFPYQNYKKACAALGRPINTIQDVPKVTKALFADAAKLVDTPLVADVGYEKAHSQWVKGVNGAPATYNLVLKTGEVLRDNDGVAIQFADKAAVALYARENNIAFDDYTRVVGLDKSAVTKSDSSDEIDF